MDVGVVDGVSARLEVNTRNGRVQNDLAAADSPEPGAGAVEIRATTGYGDITIRRTSGDPTGGEVS